MLRLICEECANEWYIDDHKKALIQACPFCLFPVPTEEEIIVDSFEKAILKTIKDLGVDCLKERSRFIGYLLDTSPDYKKEIKILSNACDSGVFHAFYGTKDQDRGTAIKVFSQVQLRMVEEEGIAEQWAKIICDSLLNAIHPQQKTTVARSMPVAASHNPATSGSSKESPMVKKGDKVWGTIIKIDGNCAELDIGTNYSAYMLFSDEVLRARKSRGEAWGVGIEIEAHVIDINHEYKTVELIMRNEKTIPQKTADQLFEEKLKTFMAESDRKLVQPTKATVSPAVNSSSAKSPSHFSANSFVGFDGSFAKAPKGTISDPPKAQTIQAPEPKQPEFVMKGTTLVKYAGTAQDVVIPEGVTAIAFRAFYMNSRIRKVTMPSTLASIEMEAFSYCSQLNTIAFNNKLWQIGIKAFSDCSSLKKLHLSNSIQVLGVESFANCVNLEEVCLPQSLTFLHEKVFVGCDKIKAVTVPRGTISIADNAFPPTVRITNE